MSDTATTPPAVPSPSSSQGEKYASLLSWFNEVPDSYINPKFTIRESPRGGFGAFVEEDVSEDELIVSIPPGARVTIADVTNDPDCGKAFKTLIEKAGPGGSTVALAGYLAKEYLLLCENAKKSEEEEKKEIKFSSYFNTLPWKRGVNSQEHVLFWSEADVEKYLTGSMAYAEATEIRDEVAFATTVINGIIGPIILQSRMGEPEVAWPALPWMKPPPPKVDGMVDGVAEAVKGAFVSILTRSFEGQTAGMDKKEELQPLLDMLQHSEYPNIRHGVNSEGVVEVRARKDIEGGSELFNQYRGEEELNMPYHRFFTRFGFVPGLTEPATALLEEKSTIFFARKKEV